MGEKKVAAHARGVIQFQQTRTRMSRHCGSGWDVRARGDIYSDYIPTRENGERQARGARITIVFLPSRHRDHSLSVGTRACALAVGADARAVARAPALGCPPPAKSSSFLFRSARDLFPCRASALPVSEPLLDSLFEAKKKKLMNKIKIFFALFPALLFVVIFPRVCQLQFRNTYLGLFWLREKMFLVN